MKSYREIADSVFERRDQYVIAQHKKKQIITRVTATVGSVALVSLAGFALFKNDAFHDAPLISVSDTTTTVTNTPTKIGDTTDATAPTTDGGIVAPTTPTTSVSVPSQTTTPSKTQSPTVTTAPSKSQPPTTTPSKTEPTKTNPTQPTASHTQPTATQTKPTQTTGTTRPTTPPQGNDFIFKYPIDASEPMPLGAMSARVPNECSVTDECVPVFLGYGLWGTHAWKPGESDPIEKFVLRIVTDTKEEVIIREIDPVDMATPEYYAELLEDENRNYIGMSYNHTETIYVPLSLCSKDSGVIWIEVTEYWRDGMVGGNCSSQVSLLYTRTEIGINFSVESIWG